MRTESAVIRAMKEVNTASFVVQYFKDGYDTPAPATTEKAGLGLGVGMRAEAGQEYHCCVWGIGQAYSFY